MRIEPCLGGSPLIAASILSADFTKLRAEIDDVLYPDGGASLEFLEKGHFSTLDILD